MENLIRSAVAENYDPAIQLEGSGPSITGNSQPLSQDSSEVHTNLIDIEKLFSKMLEALKTSGNGKKSLRKPFSAWLIFSQFQREHVLKDKPQLSFQEVSKTLGEMYHALSAEEMQRYVDLAKLDKERYLKDLDEEKAKFGDNSANGQASSQEQGDLIIPLARVKRIVKLDSDVRAISKEASIIITKATEVFIAYLATRTNSFVSQKGAKTVKEIDVIQLLHRYDQLEFLRTDFPRKVAEKAPKSRTSVPNSSASSGYTANKTPPSIMSYFPTTVPSATDGFSQSASVELEGGECFSKGMETEDFDNAASQEHKISIGRKENLISLLRKCNQT